MRYGRRVVDAVRGDVDRVEGAPGERRLEIGEALRDVVLVGEGDAALGALTVARGRCRLGGERQRMDPRHAAGAEDEDALGRHGG